MPLGSAWSARAAMPARYRRWSDSRKSRRKTLASASDLTDRREGRKSPFLDVLASRALGRRSADTASYVLCGWIGTNRREMSENAKNRRVSADQHPTSCKPSRVRGLGLGIRWCVLQVVARARVVTIVQKPLDWVDVHSCVNGVRFEALCLRRGDESKSFRPARMAADPLLGTRQVRGSCPRGTVSAPMCPLVHRGEPGRDGRLRPSV